MIYTVGHTRLSEAIFHRLQADYPNLCGVVPPSEFQPEDILVLVLDGACRAESGRWAVQCRKTGAILVHLHIHDESIIIGPTIFPERAGCLLCWESRFYSSRPKAHLFVDANPLDIHRREQSSSMTAGAISLTASAVSVWLSDILAVPRSSASQLPVQFYCWDTESLQGTRHTLLPDPLCSVCGDLPSDNPETARIVLNPRPKLNPDSDRLRDTRDLSRAVSGHYANDRVGIVRGVASSLRIRHGAVAIAGLPLADDHHIEGCSGFSTRYSTARTTALVEAMERYSSSRMRGRRLAVFGSTAELGESALDPVSFGIHSADEYKANADLLTPYSPSLQVPFVWAYSFTRREPVLLPHQLAFYPFCGVSEPIFALEGSTGCATGNCPEESLLHGLLEVVERDAFLATWYAKRRLARLDPMEANDPEIRCRCRYLDGRNYEVIALDATTDFGIPALWVMARHREHAIPNAICIGAAHMRPESALRKALRELTATVSGYTEDLKAPEKRTYASWLVDDRDRVKTMDDHTLYYCHPASDGHLRFLFESNGTTSLKEIDRNYGGINSPDLRTDLTNAMTRIFDAGYDVVAVNQTAPEFASTGLVTYKTLIPGAIPMTWGQYLRRLEGISRLENMLNPSALRGLQPVRAVNPEPHPFP
jgi:ribosomal protein S12 methylthiotransferase accessory factor